MTISGAGATLHNQYPLPDRVIQWPESEPVLPPGAEQERPASPNLQWSFKEKLDADGKYVHSKVRARPKHPRPVRHNIREAGLMSLALHRAQEQWCIVLRPQEGPQSLLGRLSIIWPATRRTSRRSASPQHQSMGRSTRVHEA